MKTGSTNPALTIKRLCDDLRIAISRASSAEWFAWGKKSTRRFWDIFKRRLKNLGILISQIGAFSAKQLSSAFKAWRNGYLSRHLGDCTANGIDTSLYILEAVYDALKTIGENLVKNPKETCPDILMLGLGFYCGSGGIDGNGGIPDLDLKLGIGWHRSIFSHSVIAGVVTEGSILALVDLAELVRRHIPESERDPFWEKIFKHKNRLSEQLIKGASAGIAYHLTIDGTLQSASYHGLPFSMPKEGHEDLLVLNSVIEGLDVLHKSETAGRKVVKKMNGFAKRIGDYIDANAIVGQKYLDSKFGVKSL